jgi:NADPH:quinone reductase-like Zn-dependent oxidoreductase
MKAVLYTAYGPPDVLQLREIEKPSPKENEVLVRVHASSINAIEWRRFTMPRFVTRAVFGKGIRKPKNMSIGGDFAGRVEAVGANVKQFQPKDDVFGIKAGAFAEYVCVAEKHLALKPANVSFEAAAAVPLAALTALQALRNQGKIQAGQQVLIYGAGGGVGTFAVQIAKSFGTEVTAVCGTRSLDIARSSGAKHVIDYTKEDFTKNGLSYDLIVAANGYHSIFEYWRALKPNGVYVVVGGFIGQMLQALFLGPFLSLGNKKMRGMMTNLNQKDLILLKELLESGKVVPVIDRSYPLAKVVEAMNYVLEGHPRGKVVIDVEQGAR